MKVLVLMGGTSAEREVSLQSGTAVLEALRNIGYQAEGWDFDPETLDTIQKVNPMWYLLLCMANLGRMAQYRDCSTCGVYPTQVRDWRPVLFALINV